MNWETWQKLSRAEREKLRDMSDVNAQLRPYIGRKVKVEPKREFRLSTFRVGITTGWKPILLAVRGNASGSSDTIGADEQFTRITVVQP